MNKLKLVMVGNGTVGERKLEQLHKIAPELKRLACATTAPEFPAHQRQADRAAAACS